MLIQSSVSSGANVFNGAIASNMSGIPNGIFIPQMQAGEIMRSRFGDVVVDTERAVVFYSGLLGMPDKTQFVLANFNSPKMQQFTLLQSLDVESLSFITMPLDINNSIIEAADIRGAADDLQINYDDLAILLIVSVHRSPDKVRLSVNSRAPLFMDVKRKFGAQYVFQNDHYKVQHML